MGRAVHYPRNESGRDAGKKTPGLRARPRFLTGLIVLVSPLTASVAHAQFMPAHDLFGKDPRDHWLDRSRECLHGFVSGSARWIDGLFGPRAPESEYRKASGSIAVALLWDEYGGFDPRLRFRVDLPLPQLDDRFHAFVGRVNRDEYVSERAPPSGAFPDRRSFDDDQTLAGIGFSARRGKSGRFDADVGARINHSLDPYLKTSYRYEWMLGSGTLLSAKETLFWQHSEGLGLTTRIDVQRMFGPWYARWTTSATISQETEGTRGYSMITATRPLSDRRALVLRADLEGETNAIVPLRDIGVKAAYRKSVFREWLVMELRTSLTWPKELPTEPRKPSWGVGIGFEMYFGPSEVTAHPVTF